MAGQAPMAANGVVAGQMHPRHAAPGSTPDPSPSSLRTAAGTCSQQLQPVTRGTSCPASHALAHACISACAWQPFPAALSIPLRKHRSNSAARSARKWLVAGWWLPAGPARHLHRLCTLAWGRAWAKSYMPLPLGHGSRTQQPHLRSDSCDNRARQSGCLSMSTVAQPCSCCSSITPTSAAELCLPAPHDLMHLPLLHRSA